MALGERIKTARLEKGLSQRQLSGDTITRNMLSLIENGSAKPSMDTLCILAARLEKPIGYFLEEDVQISPNQRIILKARSAPPEEALALLKDYKKPDALFDPEYYLLTALSCMALAEQAIGENRTRLAENYLQQAAEAGAATVYYTPELETRRLLLCHKAGIASAPELAEQLPDNTAELMLRACAALENGDAAWCAALLDAVGRRDSQWYYLRGEACLQQKRYRDAADYYLQAEADLPNIVYPRLEQCFKELEDFKQAYLYACKQRSVY